MKTYLYFFIVLLFCSTAFCQEKTVHNWEWVYCMNPEGIMQHYSNGNSMLSPGDSCGIEENGTIKIVAEIKNYYLVEYKSPEKQLGTPCPSGTLFLISKEKYNGME